MEEAADEVGSMQGGQPPNEDWRRKNALRPVTLKTSNKSHFDADVRFRKQKTHFLSVRFIIAIHA